MFNLHCTNDRLNLHTLMSRLRLQHFETFSRGLVFLETFPILVLFSLCFPSSFTYFDQHKDRCLLTGSGLQLWNIALFLFFVYSYIFVHLTFFRTFDFELNLILDGNIQNILSLDCSGSYLGLSTTGSYITQHLLFSWAISVWLCCAFGNVNFPLDFPEKTPFSCFFYGRLLV